MPATNSWSWMYVGVFGGENIYAAVHVVAPWMPERCLIVTLAIASLHRIFDTGRQKITDDQRNQQTEGGELQTLFPINLINSDSFFTLDFDGTKINQFCQQEKNSAFVVRNRQVVV